MYFGLHNVNANKEKRKVETALRFAWGGQRHRPEILELREQPDDCRRLSTPQS